MEGTPRASLGSGITAPSTHAFTRTLAASTNSPAFEGGWADYYKWRLDVNGSFVNSDGALSDRRPFRRGGGFHPAGTPGNRSF